MRACCSTRPDATQPYRELVGYTPYAVEFRYEGVDSGTESIDRDRALDLVESLLEEVRRQLPDVEEG